MKYTTLTNKYLLLYKVHNRIFFIKVHWILSKFIIKLINLYYRRLLTRYGHVSSNHFGILHFIFNL